MFFKDVVACRLQTGTEGKKGKREKGAGSVEHTQLTPLTSQLSSSHDLTTSPKPKLKAVKESGEIQIDEQTTLRGVPAIAWEYKLGNRSALEWVLDQYKESTPSDATIAAHFDTYRFADYKEHVIDLLMRVCTVSVETMGIVKGMETLSA